MGEGGRHAFMRCEDCQPLFVRCAWSEESYREINGVEEVDGRERRFSDETSVVCCPYGHHLQCASTRAVLDGQWMPTSALCMNANPYHIEPSSSSLVHVCRR
jgi:hypothetical protein